MSLLAATLLLTLAAAPGDRYEIEQWGPASPYGALWDSRTIVDIEGDITAIEAFVPAKGMKRGVRVTVTTETGPVTVHLGPAWYVSSFEPRFTRGDHVRVRGSLVKFEGKTVMLAAAVIRGKHLFNLRDDDGTPIWWAPPPPSAPGI